MSSARLGVDLSNEPSLFHSSFAASRSPLRWLRWGSPALRPWLSISEISLFTFALLVGLVFLDRIFPLVSKLRLCPRFLLSSECRGPSQSTASSPRSSFPCLSFSILSGSRRLALRCSYSRLLACVVCRSLSLTPCTLTLSVLFHSSTVVPSVLLLSLSCPSQSSSLDGAGGIRRRSGQQP